VNRSLRIGTTEVARIGLGTNRLHRTPDNEALIREAVGAGIGLIDTAHTYAGGESEATIGAALSPAPNGVVVATKGGWGAGNGRREVLRAQVDESLRRLRTETIALYYLHRVDPQTPLEESLGALQECQAAGKIAHVGLSDVSIETIERARRVVPIVAVQNHYNLAERRYDDVVDYCAREEIVFVPYFPVRDLGTRSLRSIADRHAATPTQVALAWLLERSPTILPIPGTLSAQHVKENLGALEIDLSDEEFRSVA
jgi:aryl-alcohol dehydrogenase-like predicted oxidoreductase